MRTQFFWRAGILCKKKKDKNNEKKKKKKKKDEIESVHIEY